MRVALRTGLGRDRQGRCVCSLNKKTLQGRKALQGF